MVGFGMSFESKDDRTSDGLQKAKQGWEGSERGIQATSWFGALATG